MSRFDGKVVLISGAARGQGASHAIHFAREGANLALFDICQKFDTVPYDGSTQDELDETAAACREAGATVIADRIDARDAKAVKAFAERAIAELGQVDIVVANAGIFGGSLVADMDPEMFSEMVDVNLKGVFNTIQPVLAGMIDRGYGRVIATGSVCSLVGYAGVGHYVAAKHGVAGLIRSLAKELGPHGVTANCIVPNGVGTKMILNEATYEALSPENPTLEGAAPIMGALNAIPVPFIEPADVSKIVLFTASDEAKHTTGAMMKVDLGATT